MAAIIIGVIQTRINDNEAVWNQRELMPTSAISAASQAIDESLQAALRRFLGLGEFGKALIRCLLSSS